jgi:hypothetical protein
LFALCFIPVELFSQSVSLADIEKMIDAKISDGVIISLVRQGGKPVGLSTEDVIRLKAKGARDSLIEALLNPVSNPDTAATPVQRKMEIGVYAKRDGAWIELTPEVVNIRSSSPFKVYTLRMDLNGRISGASSKITLKTPIEILLVTPEGVNANEYQLVRLRTKPDAREFRTASAGIGGAKSGVDRDAVSFDYKKTSPGHFVAQLPSAVVAGEYAFIPPASTGGAGGAAGSTGKAYTFRVLE